MGTEGAYPPFNFINDDGEVDGLERELGDELCRRANLECTWVTNEWDTIIPNLVDGKYDTILAGMSITDERDEVIDFTQPYIPPSRSVYVVLAGDGDEAETTYVPFQDEPDAAPVRLIVRRVKPTPGSQLALFASYSYHGCITDRDGDTLELGPTIAATPRSRMPFATSSTASVSTISPRVASPPTVPGWPSR